MTKICKVTFNNETFLMNCGDLLLDGALMSGVEMPYDCRSGICGSCRVRLVDGKVFGGTDESSERSIDVQMTRLRRKIEIDPREPRFLHTVRGRGYVLKPGQ